MQTVIPGTAFEPQAGRTDARKDAVLTAAFGLFSYALLSLWGYLVVGDLGVTLSPRRLVVCAIGAGIFWLTLGRLKRQSQVDLKGLLVSIIVAGLTILAVRLGLDQLSTSPIEPEHSVRWSLAWSGYFGIWLLAAVPPGPPIGRSGGASVSPDAGSLAAVDEVYLDQLMARPGERDTIS